MPLLPLRLTMYGNLSAAKTKSWSQVKLTEAGVQAIRSAQAAMEDFKSRAQQLLNDRQSELDRARRSVDRAHRSVGKAKAVLRKRKELLGALEAEQALATKRQQTSSLELDYGIKMLLDARQSAQYWVHGVVHSS